MNRFVASIAVIAVIATPGLCADDYQVEFQRGVANRQQEAAMAFRAFLVEAPSGIKARALISLSSEVPIGDTIAAMENIGAVVVEVQRCAGESCYGVPLEANRSPSADQQYVLQELLTLMAKDLTDAEQLVRENASQEETVHWMQEGRDSLRESLNRLHHAATAHAFAVVATSDQLRKLSELNGNRLLAIEIEPDGVHRLAIPLQPYRGPGKGEGK